MAKGGQPNTGCPPFVVSLVLEEHPDGDRYKALAPAVQGETIVSRLHESLEAAAQRDLEAAPCAPAFGAPAPIPRTTARPARMNRFMISPIFWNCIRETVLGTLNPGNCCRTPQTKTARSPRTTPRGTFSTGCKSHARTRRDSASANATRDSGSDSVPSPHRPCLCS